MKYCGDVVPPFGRYLEKLAVKLSSGSSDKEQAIVSRWDSSRVRAVRTEGVAVRWKRRRCLERAPGGGGGGVGEVELGGV